MKIYIEMIKLLFNKFIRRKNTGEVIKIFCENMGIVYIKFAQILATHNYKDLFTEEDRVILSNICDNCSPIEFDKINEVIEDEYKCSIDRLFNYIDPNPVGAASISQIHKAILKSGEVVALKVKRKDITENIEKDVATIKKLMHRFGKIVKFGNFIGGDHALNLYLDWIFLETNFEHEMKNIEIYTDFAKSVNNKLPGNKLIKIPKLYKELSTPNIIAMEFIPYKTINKLELNEENNKKIRSALNSYISSTLYAMFNDLKIVFHGDPHTGNVYIDDEGNIGFLDMGLLFELSDEDAKLIREFFFAVYTADSEKLYNLIVPYGKMNKNTQMSFKEDVKKYCEIIQTKPVTSYFIDMMNICLKYEVCPPNFLFCMVKAFMCLGGMNNFSNNEISGNELLKEQVIEFYIRRSLKETKNIAISSLKIAPKLLLNTCEYGVVKAIAKSVAENEELYWKTRKMIDHYKEILDVFKPIHQVEEPVNTEKDKNVKKNILTP